MAVSVEDLAIALRVSDDGSGLDVGTIGLLTRLLGVGDSHVALLIPSAPEPIQDEVRIRLAAYLYTTNRSDGGMPTRTRGSTVAPEDWRQGGSTSESQGGQHQHQDQVVVLAGSLQRKYIPPTASLERQRIYLPRPWMWKPGIKFS